MSSALARHNHLYHFSPVYYRVFLHVGVETCSQQRPSQRLSRVAVVDTRPLPFFFVQLHADTCGACTLLESLGILQK